MKHTQKLVILLLASILIWGCDTKSKKEKEALRAEITKLEEQNNQLLQGNTTMTKSVADYQNALKEIDQQLAAIDDKHELIKAKSNEVKGDANTEEEILLHIEHLHSQMENAKHKINHLNKNMADLRKENDDQHEELHKMDLYINDLANTVLERDSEIVALHDALTVQGIGLAALMQAYGEQALYNEVLLDIINTGFYVAGTTKELKEMGVIGTEGGFIGIGKVKVLSANAPVQFLTPIDIRTTDIIELACKKASLITAHAPESYEFTFDKENNITMLGIANKLKFWQETNYLVIEVIN